MTLCLYVYHKVRVKDLLILQSSLDRIGSSLIVEQSYYITKGRDITHLVYPLTNLNYHTVEVIQGPFHSSIMFTLNGGCNC